MKFHYAIRLVICLSIMAATPAVAAEENASHAFSPNRGATALVVKTIESATQSICAAAYSFTSAPVADALLAAQARGVAVRLTLDKSQARGKHLMLTRLLQQGLPVRINKRYAIMHDKFMVIDERVLQLGSFNYSKAAETKNAENVLVIRKYKKVIASYAAECDRLWDEAIIPELASLPARPAPDRQPVAPKLMPAPLAPAAPYRQPPSLSTPPLVRF